MLDLIYWPNSLKSQFNAQSLERFLWIYRVCFAIVCDSGTCKMQIYFKMFFFPFEKEKKTLSSTCEYDMRECVPFFCRKWHEEGCYPYQYGNCCCCCLESNWRQQWDVPRPYANAHLFGNHLLLTCLSSNIFKWLWFRGVFWGVAKCPSPPLHPLTLPTDNVACHTSAVSIFNFNDNSLATCCLTTTRATAKLMDKKLN